MITIELTPEEAEKFRVFADHYAFFSALIDAGLHKPQEPQYVLYFNRFRVLKGIEAKRFIYKA